MSIKGQRSCEFSSSKKRYETVEQPKRFLTSEKCKKLKQIYIFSKMSSPKQAKKKVKRTKNKLSFISDDQTFG